MESKTNNSEIDNQGLALKIGHDLLQNKVKSNNDNFRKVKARYSSTNTLRELSYSSAEYIKCPVNIGDTLNLRSTDSQPWRDFKLYVKYLDLKVQNPDCGTFRINYAHRYYQRTIKDLIKRGWAERRKRKIYLRAYQFVWRDLGISRVNVNGLMRYRYWKIPIKNLSMERVSYEMKTLHTSSGIISKRIKTGYLRDIENEIRKRIAKRKRSQIAYALKERRTEEKFSAKSAACCFGYRSTSTGSRLRGEYFELVPMTKEESKPKFNKERGRFEEPTKRIVL